MTKDLKTLLKEESNKLSIKEKEFESLILDFENQFKTENTEFNVKFSQIVSKNSIHLLFSSKKHSFVFIFTVDKEKKEYNTNYESCFKASNSDIEECVNLLNFIHKETSSQSFEVIFNFLKKYNSLYNSINRIKNKIKNISSDIAKNKDSGLISKLKFFLSSEKEIIDQNIKDFLNQDEFEKEIVCFDISKYSEKTIEFRNTKLSVSTSSGKRLFKVNKRAVSKKEAINLLKNQVFNNGKEIKHFSQTPCYQKPEKHDPYYSWKKAWSLRVEEYIKLIKPETLIQYNVDTF